MMTKGEMCDWLTKVAKEYRSDATALARDQHMHQWRGEPPQQDLLDAILIGFVNRCAMRQGIDLGLYAENLRTGDTLDAR